MHKLSLIAQPAAMATALGLVFATPLAAQTAPQGDPKAHHGNSRACHMMMARPARISVLGIGDSTISPDMATINLGVTTRAATAAEAMSTNSDQQSMVIDALQQEGIEPQDIQTSGLNLSPTMEYPEGQAPRVTGYQAQNLVTVRVRDLGTLGETLDTLVTAGANEMNGISFQRDDPRSAADEARTMAIEDAHHSAEVLAAAAGLELGPIVAIRDMPQLGGGPRPMMMARDAAAESAVPIQAGELSFSAQVQVDYALTGGDCEMKSDGMHHGGSQMNMPKDHPPMPGMDNSVEGTQPPTQPHMSPSSDGAGTPDPAAAPEAGPAPTTDPGAIGTSGATPEAPANPGVAPATSEASETNDTGESQPAAPGEPAADVSADPAAIGTESDTEEAAPTTN